MSEQDIEEVFERFAMNPAIVTVDLHRGHLDPTVATLPLDSGRASALLERTVPLLDSYRALGLPVIHVVTRYRTRDEIMSNPYWAMQAHRGGDRSAIAEHNLEHGPGIELMPGIHRASDLVLDTKQRYDSFIGTRLEEVLRSGDNDAILLFGVNTNSCILATSIAASVRDFAVFVIEDGVDTMMGAGFHDAALRLIAGSFGWVIDGATSLRVLKARLSNGTPR